MWKREDEQETEKEHVEIFNMAEFEKYGIYPTELSVKCSTCHHVWHFRINSYINPLKMICGKCSQKEKLENMKLEGGI